MDIRAAIDAQKHAPSPTFEGEHEPAPIPVKHAERVAEVEAAVGAHAGPSISLDHLLEKAANLAGIEAIADNKVISVKEPALAAMLNELVATQADLKRRADALTKERDRVTDLIKTLLGDAEELVVNGATVATYKTSTSRILNQTQVKKLFPDIEENAELYTDSERRALLFK